MNMMMKQVYSFPILKTSDIILCLNELGILVTEEELSHPEKNKEQIRKVFEFLTELCTGITREELSQPAYFGLKKLSFPDLHEESIPCINSLRAFQKMMEVCGIYDFTLKDLMEPNPKRLRKQLSGIINFAKFREERFLLLSDLSNQRETIMNRFNKAQSKNNDLTRRLSILQDQTKEEAKIIADIEADCKSIEVLISELNQHQAEIREEISDSKLQNTKLKDTIAARTLYLEDLQQTRKKLQGQIVSSPGRFRKQISDVSQSLNEEQQNIRTSERKHRELLAWAVHIEECLGIVANAQDVLNELQVESNKHREIVSSLEELRHQVEFKQDQLKALELEIHQLQRQNVRSEDKLAHIRRQGNDRAQEFRITVEQLHNEVSKYEKNRTDMKNKVEKQQNELNHLQKQLEVEIQLQDQVFHSLFIIIRSYPLLLILLLLFLGN